MGFPCGSAGKESSCNVRDLGLIPGLGRSPGEGKGYTPVFWPGEFHGLYSLWGCKELDTNERLSLHTPINIYMSCTHVINNTLTATQQGLPRQFSGKESTCRCRKHRRHGFDSWVGKIPWRRKQQLTSVFLHGKSHGQRSLVGYSSCSSKESDMTE